LYEVASAQIVGEENLGLHDEQVIEAILQLMFYAGGAAVRNALVHCKDLLAEPAPAR